MKETDKKKPRNLKLSLYSFLYTQFNMEGLSKF